MRFNGGTAWKNHRAPVERQRDPERTKAQLLEAAKAEFAEAYGDQLARLLGHLADPGKR